ncbi:MAG: Obg family GTPase CgtA, partial [Actinomycetota bacterium]|nr:Obg family GTPase CgtA [Actinomycetota bacterium]
GKGLGLEFLRHIERCAVLVHVVDCATVAPGRDPLSDVDALEQELAAYTPSLGGELASRPRLVVLNKIDVPDARELAEMVSPELTARGLPVYCVSTVTTEGLRDLTFALGAAVRQHRSAQPPPEPTRVVLRPSAVDESTFEVIADPDQHEGFIVRGIRPQRWVRQTNFDNAEAVGYLADRLARLGVEDALAAAGARAGCPVTIGDVTFEWEPSTPARAAAVRLGGRGTDWRLDDDARISAAQRKAARRIRREPSAGSSAPDDSSQESVDVGHD